MGQLGIEQVIDQVDNTAEATKSQLISVQQASNKLHIERSLITEWCRSGFVKFHKPGKQHPMLVEVDSLLSYFKKVLEKDVEPDIPGEIWKDVAEFPDQYMVSDHGRIKRKPNTYDPSSTRFGTTPKAKKLSVEILKTTSRVIVGLTIDGHTVCRSISRLVADAFIGRNPALEGQAVYVKHRDKNGKNNRAQNLYYEVKLSAKLCVDQSGQFLCFKKSDMDKYFDLDQARVISHEEFVSVTLKSEDKIVSPSWTDEHERCYSSLLGDHTHISDHLIDDMFENDWFDGSRADGRYRLTVAGNQARDEYLKDGTTSV